MKNLDNVSITAIGSNAERYVKDLMEKRISLGSIG